MELKRYGNNNYRERMEEFNSRLNDLSALYSRFVVINQDNIGLQSKRDTTIRFLTNISLQRMKKKDPISFHIFFIYNIFYITNTSFFFKFTLTNKLSKTASI